jgi:hypothetical protein
MEEYRDVMAAIGGYEHAGTALSGLPVVLFFIGLF